MKGKKYNLGGKLLVATHHLTSDTIFYKTVVYVVQHARDGALGIIVNNPLNINERVTVQAKDHEHNPIDLKNIDIHIGGHLELERAYVLYNQKKIKVGTTAEELLDLVENSLTHKGFLVLGHLSWDEGQLEQEIKDNYWLVTQATKQLVFTTDNQDKWEAALDSMNINPFHITSTNGSC